MISRTQAERRRLLASITGQTPSVETSLKTVHFNHRKLLTVFPGDVLEIAVYDEDVSEHDLYGMPAIPLDRQTLDGGELEISMPNVRHVQLRFERLTGR